MEQRQQQEEEEEEEEEKSRSNVPIPHPHPNKKNGPKKVKVPSHPKLNHTFLNPEKIKAFTSKNDPEPQQPIPSSLSHPTLHSTLFKEKQIHALEQEKYLTLSKEMFLSENQKKFLTEKVVNLTLHEKMYDNLISVDAPTPKKKRLIPKQIDSKWKKSLCTNEPPAPAFPAQPRIEPPRPLNIY